MKKLFHDFVEKENRERRKEAVGAKRKKRAPKNKAEPIIEEQQHESDEEKSLVIKDELFSKMVGESSLQNSPIKNNSCSKSTKRKKSSRYTSIDNLTYRDSTDGTESVILDKGQTLLLWSQEEGFKNAPQKLNFFTVRSLLDSEKNFRKSEESTSKHANEGAVFREKAKGSLSVSKTRFILNSHHELLYYLDGDSDNSEKRTLFLKDDWLKQVQPRAREPGSLQPAASNYMRLQLSSIFNKVDCVYRRAHASIHFVSICSRVEQAEALFRLISFRTKKKMLVVRVAGGGEQEVVRAELAAHLKCLETGAQFSVLVSYLYNEQQTIVRSTLVLFDLKARTAVDAQPISQFIARKVSTTHCGKLIVAGLRRAAEPPEEAAFRKTVFVFAVKLSEAGKPFLHQAIETQVPGARSHPGDKLKIFSNLQNSKIYVLQEDKTYFEIDLDEGKESPI